MPKQEKVKINVKERLDGDTIDLSLSELIEVPVKDIMAFKRVTVIDLSNNKIFSLGKNFSQLTQITKLDLSKNQIRYLPEDFGNLKNLRHLDLYNNRIEHLPLTFGNLHSLRYLDLKANPLTPALAKIVGPCLTTKDCHESAKITVKFLAQMQLEVEKAKEKLQDQNETKIEVIEDVTKKQENNNKTKKNKKKKSKKSNKSNDNNTSSTIGKLNNALKLNSNKNRNSYDLMNSNDTGNSNSTVLKTILLFFTLLSLNVLMLYIITVKHPEIADWLVEMIPANYRDLIVSKSEDMRLNMIKISNWIHKFRTPPPSMKSS